MQKASEVASFLVGIGFKNISAQMITKEQLKENKLAVKILLHICRWCRGLRQANDLHINSHLVDKIQRYEQRFHDIGLKCGQQLLLILKTCAKLNVPMNMMMLLKPDKDQLANSIMRLRKFGVKRMRILQSYSEDMGKARETHRQMEALAQQRRNFQRVNNDLRVRKETQKDEVMRQLARKAQLQQYQITQGEKLDKVRYETGSLKFSIEQAEQQLKTKEHVKKQQELQTERLRREVLKCTDEHRNVKFKLEKQTFDLQIEFEKEEAHRKEKISKTRSRMKHDINKFRMDLMKIKKNWSALRQFNLMKQENMKHNEELNMKENALKKLSHDIQQKMNAIQNSRQKWLKTREQYSSISMDNNNIKSQSSLKIAVVRKNQREMTKMAETHTAISQKVQKLSASLNQCKSKFQDMERQLRHELKKVHDYTMSLLQKVYFDMSMK